MTRVAITTKVTTKRSVEEAFAYLSDVSRHPEWSPKAMRVEELSGPVQKGTTFTSYGWIPGDKEHRNEVEVTEVDAPTRFQLTSREQGENFYNTFTLESTGAGTTITRVMDMPKPGGAIGVLFPLLKATIVQPGVQKGMTMLGAKLDSGA